MARLPARLHVPARHRLLAGTATAILLVVSVLHLMSAAAGDPGQEPAAMASAALGAAGIVAALRLSTARCFESRLTIVLIGGATLLGVALAHTVGAPGSAPVAWSPRDVLLAALAAGLTASWPATVARRAAERCPR
ncbi:hypothetical protein R8Z57_12965 [Microbacterium sp. M3]|uniref:Uncharacterized protein n=1 Tax=Microbacterium arthrosphaerae TaxID=792652 RepID=A0ABU4H2X5_9MICO|nr:MULTISPECIES: hypothetical protein [Microbacterium]MDW4573684.1 hypothetical protein [Microbacterium arthrosphaerae]MDW7607539.1 hypothetical protein [Microbacterium sp. M3]